MTDFQAIDSALLEALSNDGTVASLITTFESVPAIFRGIAPNEATDPYIVIHDIAIVPDDTHSTVGERAAYQVNVHGINHATCRNIMSAINKALHYGVCTITGYKLVSIVRLNGPNALPQDGDDKLVGQTSDYLVTVQES